MSDENKKADEQGINQDLASSAGTSPDDAKSADDAEREAKAKAAAEALAARARERAAKTAESAPEGGEPEKPKEPSPNQPKLDRVAAIIREHVHQEALVESFINEKDGHMPYLVINGAYWFQTASLLKQHEDLRFDYLRNVSGTDMETHLEVVYHVLSLTHKHEAVVKVKTDRNEPSVNSVTPVWETANWNEREIYDLLGIEFPGHPDLRRIMMPDEWVGYPLRKDYEPIDPEV